MLLSIAKIKFWIEILMFINRVKFPLEINNIKITINSYSYTIITAHVIAESAACYFKAHGITKLPARKARPPGCSSWSARRADATSAMPCVIRPFDIVAAAL